MWLRPSRHLPPRARGLVGEIPEHFGKFKWGHRVGVYRTYSKGWKIIKTEAEGICSEHILKGFVFSAKEFYTLRILFKHK